MITIKTSSSFPTSSVLVRHPMSLASRIAFPRLIPFRLKTRLGSLTGLPDWLIIPEKRLFSWFWGANIWSKIFRIKIYMWKRMLQGLSGILTILVKLAYDGLVLGSTQFLLLPQLSQKMMFASKVVKNDSKIIILLCFVNLNLRHTAYI